MKNEQAKKICVFGVGRSGTTAIYALLQHMMVERFGNHVSFVYEPFLRKRDCFDALFEKVLERFNYVDSISVEGLQAHLRLPLFISEPDVYLEDQYLKKVFEENNQKNALFKFIRASGRYRLLQKSCPDCIFIFTIRNPIDSVYSAMSKFSYYGGEFHKDDYPRFVKEVNLQFGTNYSLNSFHTRLEKEIAFWYYTNKFAFRTFSHYSEMPLIICYENYTKKTDYYVRTFCRLLDMEYKPEYGKLAKKEVGPITREFVISPREKEVFEPYMSKYTEVLKKIIDEPLVDTNEIWKKYKIDENAPERKNPFYGFHGLYIKRQYEVLAKKNEVLKKSEASNLREITEIKEKLKEKEAAICQQKMMLDSKTEQIQRRDEKISTLIRQQKMMLDSKAEQIQRKDEKISTLIRQQKMMLDSKTEQIQRRDEKISTLIRQQKMILDSKTEQIQRKDEKISTLIRQQKMILDSKTEQIQRKDEKISTFNQAWKCEMEKSIRMKALYELERKEKGEIEKKLEQMKSQRIYRLMRLIGLLK